MPKPSSRIPRRNPLTDQAADWMRDKIRTGVWSEEFPTEATLCRELQISRVTLRRALHILTVDGDLLGGGRGARRWVNPLRTTALPQQAGRIIRVLAPFSYWKMGAVHHAILEGLTHRVAGRNLRIEFESRPHLFTNFRTKEMERLKALPDTAGWVLFFSTEAMQRWFASNGLPCVVAGRLHDTFDLPCAYPDNEAVAQHAAGLLIGRGHRRLAVLTARNTSLGDRLGSAAFREQARLLGAEAILFEYDEEPASVCLALNSLFAARPALTACFMTCPEDGVTALCHALKAGVPVPGGLDFLLGWDDPILEYTVPALAHYRFNGSLMGRKIGSLILARIDGKRVRTQETRFLGEFVGGGTLRHPVRR